MRENYYDELVAQTVRLGFSKELGELVAKQLGSPKAMERMLGYLRYVKPKSEELIVDEMLAIRSDIDRWRDKKAAETNTIWYHFYVESKIWHK